MTPCALAARLVRRELSASRTYRLALERLGEQAGASELRRIEREHGLAALELRVHCALGAAPAGPGWLGWWSASLESFAHSFGDTAAVLALKRGEALGLKDYERAALGGEAPPRMRELIESLLLPQTREHLLALDDFLRLRRGD